VYGFTLTVDYDYDYDYDYENSEVAIELLGALNLSEEQRAPHPAKEDRWTMTKLPHYSG
jgi:hypothetical protein